MQEAANPPPHSSTRGSLERVGDEAVPQVYRRAQSEFVAFFDYHVVDAVTLLEQGHAGQAQVVVARQIGVALDGPAADVLNSREPLQYWLTTVGLAAELTLKPEPPPA